MICLDTCMLIYVYERGDLLGDRARAAMRSSPDRMFGISPLVKLECLVNSTRSGNYALIQSYEHAFSGFENLVMDEETFLR